jgi:hypothetical protein
MNAQNETPNSQNPIDPTANGAPPADATCNLQPSTCNGDGAPDHQASTTNPINFAKPRRRNGLVAQLPKPVRARINQLLDDGLSYPKIVKVLGPDAPGLTVRAVMSWQHGGYQDYLRQQQLLDECRARTERAFTMMRDQNAIGAFQATQQVATAQICEAVADMGGDVLRQALAANPLNYFRMLNSFARLTNGGLKCDRHLHDDLDRRSKALQSKQPGGMTPEAIKEMEDTLRLL